MEKNKFEQIFQLMPSSCLVLKPAGNVFKIIDVNNTLLKKYDLEKETLLGKEIWEAFPPAYYSGTREKSVLQKSFENILLTKKADKIGLLRYDLYLGEELFEKYWDSENIPVLDSEGNVELILHCVQDVTEQVNAQNKQREYQYYVEENSDGIYSLDKNGKFTNVNEGLATMAELPREELLQRDFLPFCAPHDRERIFDFFHQSLQGKSNKFEADFISAKGKKLVLQISLMPIENDQEIIGAFGIARNYTRIRNTEKIVIEKSKFLEVNASFISSLLEKELNETTLQKAFAVIGEAVAVERMYYFRTHKAKDSNQTLISQIIEWTSKEATSQIDNPEMQNIPADQLEEIMGPLSQNIPFISTLSELPECEMKEIFLDQDIKSMLLLPIFFKENLYGFIGFDDCSEERKWNDDEIIFLKSLAYNLTTALEKRAANVSLKEREEELIKSEKKFKALVQAGTDLIAVLDAKGNYLYASETTTAILGIEPEYFIGKNAFEFIHPEDFERISEIFAQIGEQRQIKAPPYRFKDGKGNWRWLETNVTNLLDDAAVEGIVVNSRDVTKVLQQAHQIQQINERYKLAATATQDLIYDWDLHNDEVVRFHRSLDDLFGYTEAEVAEKEFWRKQIHPDDYKIDQRKLEQALQDPNENFIRSEYRFKRADGSYARVVDKGYILRNENGKPVRLIGATSDISDIKAKEEALQISNQRFKFAMKATNEIIWDWDLKSGHTIRSKSFKKILGFENNKKNASNAFWRTRMSEKDKPRVEASLKAALEDPNQKKWKDEYTMYRADGELAYVADRGFIIRDNAGNPVRMVGAVLDVTASRKLLKEIKKHNKILREIAWEQSHVVRAPLARLKGLLHLLEIEAFETMGREEILQHTLNSADELDEIVRGIVTKTEQIKIG